MQAVIAIEGTVDHEGNVWSREAVAKLASDSVTVHEREDGRLEAVATVNTSAPQAPESER